MTSVIDLTFTVHLQLEDNESDEPYYARCEACERNIPLRSVRNHVLTHRELWTGGPVPRFAGGVLGRHRA